MSDWLHNLPLTWMALVVFGFTYLLAAAIYAGVAMLAVGERAKSFRAVSAAILAPLGILFGLFVAFTAAQVWSDSDHAGTAVSREASALRAITVLAGAFPGESERLRGFVRDYIQQAANVEWPLMARQEASLNATPRPLADALALVLSMTTSAPGQQTAQHEIVSALETALDARRQRIIVSHSEVNFVKWWCLYVQAACVLIAIAVVHSENRLAATIAMGLYATGIAASVLLIAAHDRPFTGQISVSAEPLLQVMPDAPKAK
jgi:energy-converting hydrogenase Eha subunit C